MAMSKQEQKAAAERIMAKSGPLTLEELGIKRQLEVSPPYQRYRVCLICDMVFEPEEIREHVEHMASHQPSAGQWVEAHRRIEAGKDRAKEKERQNLSA